MDPVPCVHFSRGGGKHKVLQNGLQTWAALTRVAIRHGCHMHWPHSVAYPPDENYWPLLKEISAIDTAIIQAGL
jgi:hypothetical protein